MLESLMVRNFESGLEKDSEARLEKYLVPKTDRVCHDRMESRLTCHLECWKVELKDLELENDLDIELEFDLDVTMAFVTGNLKEHSKVHLMVFLKVHLWVLVTVK